MSVTDERSKEKHVMKKRLSTADSERVTVVANTLANRIIAGEGMRLALLIADKIAAIVRAQHRKIEEKYGEVL